MGLTYKARVCDSNYLKKDLITVINDESGLDASVKVFRQLQVHQQVT